MTIFTNIKTGRVIYAVEDRSAKAVAPFMKKLAEKAKNLKGIAMDMSGSYSLAASQYLSYVPIVYDRFHVSKLLNDAVDEVRRIE